MRFWFVLAALACATGLPRAAAGSLPLVGVADVPLPGNSTRLDYQSLDSKRHLLFIAHLGDSEVIVVDTVSRTIVATIPNVRDVHGVTAVPQLDMVYASATGTNEVVAIDEKSLRVVARTEGGVYPDGIAFDPNTRRIFVSDEHGKTDTVIDTRLNKRIGTISLGGDVGNTQYDAASRHIFVNVQGTGQLVEIDPSDNAVVRRVFIGGQKCMGNHGLLIDSRKRRAFVACEESGTLLLIDMRTMRVVRSWDAGEGPDVVALDDKTNRVFVAAEGGTVSIFSDGGRVEQIAQAYFAPAAHTVAVDPATQLVYFPLENINGKPVLRIVKERT